MTNSQKQLEGAMMPTLGLRHWTILAVLAKDGTRSFQAGDLGETDLTSLRTTAKALRELEECGLIAVGQFQTELQSGNRYTEFAQACRLTADGERLARQSAAM
jgi:DNA-binding MarR family transcriptional regulator